jgi:hypothetical protein
MNDWRETLEIESRCHKALQDSPVAHSRIATAIDAALKEIDRLTAENQELWADRQARIFDEQLRQASTKRETR